MNPTYNSYYKYRKETFSSVAREAEEKGEYASAAAGFFALGAYLLANESYENTPGYREGIATLLRSIELDDRIQNYSRARQTSSFLRDNIRPMVDNDAEPVIRGLGYEWAGDSQYMIGDEQEARTAYQTALEQFTQLDFDTQLHWGARPEYDTALLAILRFFERRDTEYYEKHDLDFTGRLEWKLERCRSDSTEIE